MKEKRIVIRKNKYPVIRFSSKKSNLLKTKNLYNFRHKNFWLFVKGQVYYPNWHNLK